MVQIDEEDRPRRRTLRWRLAIGALLCVAAAGALVVLLTRRDSSPTASKQAPPSMAASPETSAPDGPKSCGTYVIMSSDLRTSREQQQCLLDAFEVGEAATLAYQFSTEEGDPIFVSYLVVGPHLVDVRTDSTRDHFGDQRIVTTRCTGLTVRGAILDAAGCVET
jgi:hypothetical protein